MISELLLAHDNKFPKYAWPGGYPMFYVGRDNQIYCSDCANQKDAEPSIVEYDVNWEDENMTCDGCSKHIESAYGDD